MSAVVASPMSRSSAGKQDQAVDEALAPVVAPRPRALPAEEVTGPRFRLASLVVVVALFVVGQLAALAGLRLVGQLSTSAFLQVGAGVVACAYLPSLPRHVHVLLSIVGGASVVVLLSSASALTGAFSLDVAWRAYAVVVLAGAVVAGVVEVSALRHESRARHAVRATRLNLRPALPSVLAVIGFVVALVAAGVHRGNPEPSGAALSAGPVWFVGVALVLGSVGLAWFARGRLALPVLALSTVVIASQGVMYREPTAVVAARHIGLVDWVLTRGVLDRSTDIYQAWAGLFASAALNARAAGIDDLFRYASWWGVLVAPVMVLAVRALAGRFVDVRRAWLAGLLFGLGSSLNTSFFAPQVIGFVMAITVLALLARRVGERALLPLPAVVGVVLTIDVANAITHQISPFMLGLALVALAVFNLVTPRWAFVLAFAPAIAWALINRHLLNSYVSVSAIGKLLANLSPPEHSVGAFPVPLSNRLAFDLPAAGLLVIGLVALVALFRRRDRVAWGLAFAAASPVALMAGTSYGNEGIFRVALFALPWLAVLAVLVDLPPTRPGRVRVPVRLGRVVGAVAVSALFAVNVVGLTAMDWARVVRADDVTASHWVEQTAPVGSVVLTLGSDLTIPYDSLANYADTGWVSRSELAQSDTAAGEQETGYPTTTGAAYDAEADLRRLTADFAAVNGTAHYAVDADSSGAYDQRYGNQRYADHQKLSAAIAANPQWERVYALPGITVYRLRTS